MNKIREIIKAGSPTFGAFQSLPSALVSEALGMAGLDWTCVDLQHGGADWHSLLQVIYGAEAGGIAPLVRVPWCDPAQIMRALDLGAVGVIVPMVSTPQEAKIAADACRYAPAGMRSIGPTRAPITATYIPDADADVLCLPMIETAEGLANVEAIAATPGVDGLFLGPGDLALSLGLQLSMAPGPEILDAVDRVVAACRRHSLIPGTIGFDDATIELLLLRGMRLIGMANDKRYVLEGASRDAGRAKGWKEKFGG